MVNSTNCQTRNTPSLSTFTFDVGPWERNTTDSTVFTFDWKSSMFESSDISRYLNDQNSELCSRLRKDILLKENFLSNSEKNASNLSHTSNEKDRYKERKYGREKSNLTRTLTNTTSANSNVARKKPTTDLPLAEPQLTRPEYVKNQTTTNITSTAKKSPIGRTKSSINFREIKNIDDIESKINQNLKELKSKTKQTPIVTNTNTNTNEPNVSITSSRTSLNDAMSCSVGDSYDNDEESPGSVYRAKKLEDMQRKHQIQYKIRSNSFINNSQNNLINNAKTFVLNKNVCEVARNTSASSHSTSRNVLLDRNFSDLDINIRRLFTGSTNANELDVYESNVNESLTEIRTKLSEKYDKIISITPLNRINTVVCKKPTGKTSEMQDSRFKMNNLFLENEKLKLIKRMRQQQQQQQQKSPSRNSNITATKSASRLNAQPNLVELEKSILSAQLYNTGNASVNGKSDVIGNRTNALITRNPHYRIKNKSLKNHEFFDLIRVDGKRYCTDNTLDASSLNIITNSSNAMP